MPEKPDPVVGPEKRVLSAGRERESLPAAPEIAPRDDSGEWWPMVEVAQVGLYAENPFRTLGLRTFAAPGEIARRAEELGAGRVAPRWAFATRTPAPPARLNDAAQTLKGGLGRLFAEFFWFWPETYPEEKTDPAIEALAVGDITAACDHWENVLSHRRGVAAHNLAVLFHQLALDCELARGTVDEEIAEWWAVAGEHWNLALADEEVWSRLESRIKRFDDPRVPADFARRVRQALPVVLVRIQSAAIVARAEAGEHEAAALLLDAGFRAWTDGAPLGRAVEAGLRRIFVSAEEQVEAAARDVAREARPCLACVEDLLRNTAGVRRLATVLGDHGIEAGRRFCNQVLDVAATGVSEHRRRTLNHSAVLPWLVHLSTLPAAPEVARRVAEARNATLADVLTARMTPGKETDPSIRLETGYRVLAESLVPAADRVEWWSAKTRAAYLRAVGVLLRELAHDAYEMLDEFDLSSRALELAAEISGPEVRGDIRAERRKLWRQFMTRHKEGIRVEHAGYAVEIDPQRLVFNGVGIDNGAVSRLRYGRAGAAGVAGYRVGWCAGREVVELDTLNLFATDEDASEVYQLVIDALEVHVLPDLAERLVQKLRAGESIVLGTSALRPEGFVFRRRGGPEGKGSDEIPYAHLRCRVEGDELVLSKADDAAAVVRFSLSEVWNAVAIPAVLARLGAKS